MYTEKSATFNFMISNLLCKNYHKQHFVVYTATSNINIYENTGFKMFLYSQS